MAAEPSDLARDASPDFDDWLEVDVDTEIVDSEIADRMLYRLGILARREDELNQFVRNRVAELNDWSGHQQGVIDRQREHIERNLEGYARTVNAVEKRLTWKLPSGEITLREAQPRVLLVADEEYVAVQLTEAGHGDLVKEETVHHVPRNAIKQVVEPGQPAVFESEEPPPGYEYREALRRAVNEETGEVTTSVLPGLILVVGTQRRFKASPS